MMLCSSFGAQKEVFVMHGPCEAHVHKPSGVCMAAPLNPLKGCSRECDRTSCRRVSARWGSATPCCQVAARPRGLERMWVWAVWVKMNRRGYAGFGPGFHLPGFHFGYIFLAHGHVSVAFCACSLRWDRRNSRSFSSPDWSSTTARSSTMTSTRPTARGPLKFCSGHVCSCLAYGWLGSKARVAPSRVA